MSRRIGVLAAFVMALLLPVPAFAANDAPLAQEPGVHEVLARAPSTVVLAFAWDLDSESTRIYVLDSKGKNVTSSAPDISGSNATVQLDFGLDRGTYSVYYRTTDRDGGLIGGAYQFAIEQGSWTKLKTPDAWVGSAEQPTIFKGENPNQPATKKDLKPKATQSPGLEIVKQDGTVEHPADITKAKDTAASSNGSSLPWFIGGGVALVAVVLATMAIVKRRRMSPVYAGKRINDTRSDD